MGITFKGAKYSSDLLFGRRLVDEPFKGTTIYDLGGRESREKNLKAILQEKNIKGVNYKRHKTILAPQFDFIEKNWPPP